MMGILSTTTLAATRLAQHVLGEDAAPPGDFGAAVQVYNSSKGTMGKTGVAEKLGLSEQELVAFEKSFREAQRRSDRNDPDGDGVDARQAKIACLRFLSWIETINSGPSPLDISVALTTEATDSKAQAQVRAVELILRALINESYKTQEQLLERLGGLFKTSVVDKWQRSGDKGDVLSGTMFSELASLFVNKQEYSRYTELFTSEEHLVFLRDARKTSQSFLEDIRRIRNAVAHNKKLTTIQLALLDLYYVDLTTPLQEACDQGETQVNPDDYIATSPEELAGYFAELKEDVLAVQEDLDELRTALGATEEKVQRLQTGVLYIVGGIILFIVLNKIGASRWTALVVDVGSPDNTQLSAYLGGSARAMAVSGLLFLAGCFRVVCGRMGLPLMGPIMISLLGRVSPSMKRLEERLPGRAGSYCFFVFLLGAYFYWEHGGGVLLPGGEFSLIGESMGGIIGLLMLALLL